MYNPTDYAYIVGRLRALETRLLTPNIVERMIDADSAEDTFKILNDLSFLNGCMGDCEAKDFQTVLKDGVAKMLRLVKRMSPNPDVINFLNLKYDFHNLKVSLKAKLTERGYEHIKHALWDYGTLAESQWEQFVLDGEIPPLTEGMHDTINDVYKQYEINSDPQIVDMLVDKHYLIEMLSAAERLGSDLTIRYLKRLIDLTNLRTFIRCKELNKEEGYFESVLLSGGNISFDAYVDSYKKNYEDLRLAIEQRMYSDDLVACLDEFTNEGSLLSVEKKMAEALENFMKESNRISFGPEPVFAFFWRFENHMQILRTILVGKLNMLSSEEIRRHTLTI